jgi:hypothetical protein
VTSSLRPSVSVCLSVSRQVPGDLRRSCDPSVSGRGSCGLFPACADRQKRWRGPVSRLRSTRWCGRRAVQPQRSGALQILCGGPGHVGAIAAPLVTGSLQVMIQALRRDRRNVITLQQEQRAPGMARKSKRACAESLRVPKCWSGSRYRSPPLLRQNRSMPRVSGPRVLGPIMRQSIVGYRISWMGPFLGRALRCVVGMRPSGHESR